MKTPRTPTSNSLGGRYNDTSHDSQGPIRGSPQALLSPDSSKQESPEQESLKPEHPSPAPSRQVLFSYQNVFFICRKSAISLSSLVCKKTEPEPNTEPNPEPTSKRSAQPKSIMSLKLDRLKDKCYGLKARTSPEAFRCAGYVFLILVLLILGLVIVGWYGLSEDTIYHETSTSEPITTMSVGPGNQESFSLAQATSNDQPVILDQRDVLQVPPVTATNPPETTPTDPSEDSEDITVVQTIIVTITSVITDTELKTLTTTVLLSTCTTCTTTPTIASNTDTTDSYTSTAKGVMTGIMYCSFTGRRNIYTLCPLVHTDSSVMLTGTPEMVSSAAPRMKNSFTTVRLAIISLWNSIPSLGRVMQLKEAGEYACNCTGMKKKLDSAADLIRMQQRLLDSQRAMISEHRKSLSLALETLVNITAARISEKTPRGNPLDLKI